jgi:hypothetical protein
MVPTLSPNTELSHGSLLLIHPGQTFFLITGNAMLCGDCIRDKDAIRVTKDLLVVIDRDLLVLRRGDVSHAVLPGEVRHLVDALVEGKEKLADRKPWE